MRLRPTYIVTFLFIAFAVVSCSTSIQTDKSIKEERASSAQTGPIVVTATIRMNDGSALRNRDFHLITISRDQKGDINQLEQLFGIKGTTDEKGSLRFEVPREKVAATHEFSFGMNSSNPYGLPLIIRRKDAKEFLTFKADDKTKSVDLGEVIIPIG